jgi:hypothetical protein
MSLQIGWDLSKNTTGLLPSVIGEVNWSSISFDNSSKVYVPNKRGVYIVSVVSNIFRNCSPFSNFETPAYIGMSTDLRKRFEAHTAGRSDDALWRRLGSSLNYCTFWYGVFQDHSAGELRKIEQALIDVYGSPLNRINSVKIGDTISAHTL